MRIWSLRRLGPSRRRLRTGATAISRRAEEHTVDPSEPIVVVTSDSHIGPRPEDLRPYCPAAYLKDFDQYFDAAPTVRVADTPRQSDGTKPRRHELNLRT